MQTYLIALRYRISRFFKFISKNVPKTLLIIIIIYIFTFSIILSFTHYTFSTYAWDTGIFDQALWSTLYGKPFYYTVEPFLSPNNSFLATHFAPILILVLPFYAVYPQVETLLVIHVTVIAFGALAVYKLTELILKNDKYAFVLALAYLLNPLVIGATTEWFHLEDFFIVMALFSLYFFFKRSWKGYIAFTILTLMTIEYAAIPVLLFGILGILLCRKSSNRETKTFYISLITIAVAVAWFILARNVQIILGFRVEGIFSGWNILGADSLEQVPVRALQDPAAAWRALTYDSTTKSLYLLLIFAPLLFMAFLKPLYFLPALPWLAAALLSDYTQHYMIWTHYSSFLIPYLFLATIFGLKEFLSSGITPYTKKLMRLIQISFLVVSIITIVWGVSPYSHTQTVDIQHITSLHEILGLVPSNLSILTQNNIFPHVSGRFEAYTIPSPLWEGFASKATEMLNITLEKRPEYVLIDLKANDPGSQATADLIYEKVYKERLPYGLLVAHDGIFLFKLGYSGCPIMFDLINTYNYRSLMPQDGRIVAYQDSKSGYVLYRDVNYANGTTFWFGPYALLPPGKYAVTFHLMIDEPTNEYIMTLDAFAFDLKKQLAYGLIYGSNFTEPRAWHSLTLYFELDEPSSMEFRGFNVYSTVDVYLDYVEVKAVDTISRGGPE